jgi:hypothetical protein
MGSSSSKPANSPNYVPAFEPKDWDEAHPRNLINRCSTRKGPVRYEGGSSDWSFTSDGLMITDVSPHGHITAKSNHFTFNLDPRWCDNNWVKAPDCQCEDISAFKLHQEALKKMKEQNEHTPE